VAYDDLLAMLVRAAERGEDAADAREVSAAVGGSAFGRAVRDAVRDGAVVTIGGGLALTEAGGRKAAMVIRRHRRWEHYLVGEAGLAPDHVHDAAGLLEHFGVEPGDEAAIDPHGRVIP
jgi:hypothetical protein